MSLPTLNNEEPILRIYDGSPAFSHKLSLSSPPPGRLDLQLVDIIDGPQAAEGLLNILILARLVDAE
jgi:hypothetical protein